MKKIVVPFMFLSILGWSLPVLAGPLDRSVEGRIILAAAKDGSTKKAVAKSEPSLPGTQAWFSVYSGYDYALMGDLQDGLKDWEGVFEENGGVGSTAVGGSGFLTGLELGIPLDEDNALSLQVESILYRTQSVLCDYNMGSEYGDLILQPTVLDLALNYKLRLSGAGGNGTHLLAGVGYFIGIVDVSASESLVLDGQYQASLSGETIGGILGLIQNFDLGGGFGLQIGVKGRLATIGKLTSDKIHYDGTSGSADIALARDNSGDPEFALVAPQLVGVIDASPTIDYTVLDLSGVQAIFNLEVAL